MRVFIAVIVLIFSFQSWTKADDISDFEIDGMSVGDSALKYVSKETLSSNKRYMWDNKKYFHAIWHLFYISGCICHYFAIVFYTIPYKM